MKATLLDAVQSNKEHPQTFELPNDTNRLRAGDFAKISMQFESPEKLKGERFWVHIMNRDGDRFTGTVNNALRCTEYHGVNNGDEIKFETRHVLECLVSANDPEIA